jgi:hypothetical protein
MAHRVLWQMFADERDAVFIVFGMFAEPDY